MLFLIEFLAVLLPLTLSPGPATIALAGQGVIHGFYKSLPFYLGLLTSTFLITLICSFGMSELILDNPMLFKFLKYVGIAYIAYLGIKLIRAKPSLGGNVESKYTFINGFTISILNPKLFVMIMSIFGQFVGQNSDFLHVIGVFIVVIAFSQAVWLGIGSSMKSFMSSTPPLNIITSGFGVILIGMSQYLLIKG